MLHLLSFLPKPAVQGLAWTALFVGCCSTAMAEFSLPNIFGDHMVVQRDQENPIWGKADANAQVTVTVVDRKVECTADSEGHWKCMLPSLAVGGPYQIKATSNGQEIRLTDVLAGEVWICSGQSNMQWAVGGSEDFELEKISANYPSIRMINFPQVGSQQKVWSHDDRQWKVCNSENVAGFSAVGYFFGRQLHQSMNVPIGLINNAWGGSAAEAWVDQSVLQSDERFSALIKRWEASQTRFEELDAKRDRTTQEQKEHGDLKRNLSGNHRPGNIYHGVLESHLGYGIRGAIWYQGESNAQRAYQYRELFPLMITHWRDRWGQGNFPFYWVQLADYQPETTGPEESAWAELREAQTMTLDRLEHVGQAVIIDIGEGKDIHPRNKVEVGRRLARLALRNEYHYQIAAESPRFESMETEGNAAILKFSNLGEGWRPFDVDTPLGFTIAGEDKAFVDADVTILEDGRLKVTADGVSEPKSVRYAWANNPIVNMFNKSDLPLTPFRTDDWQGATANNQ